MKPRTILYNILLSALGVFVLFSYFQLILLNTSSGIISVFAPLPVDDLIIDFCLLVVFTIGSGLRFSTARKLSSIVIVSGLGAFLLKFLVLRFVLNETWLAFGSIINSPFEFLAVIPVVILIIEIHYLSTKRRLI